MSAAAGLIVTEIPATVAIAARSVPANTARATRMASPSRRRHRLAVTRRVCHPTLALGKRDPCRQHTYRAEARASDYVQEGPLTTFFSSARRRSTIDSLSERVASFRTADIRRNLRRDPPPLRSVVVDEDDSTPMA